MRNIFLLFIIFFVNKCFSVTVIATVEDKNITDIDITHYTKIMNRLNKNQSLTNRNLALSSMIDDEIKTKYAESLNISIKPEHIDEEYKKLNVKNLSLIEQDILKKIIKSNIAWQTVIGATIIPKIQIDKTDLDNELNLISKSTGLPIKYTLLRISKMPKEIYTQLTKPKNCKDAEYMIKSLGGMPQKINVFQYELSQDIKNIVLNLNNLTWSKYDNGTVILICSSQKTKEYDNLNKIIKQNALYKKALQIADQKLKQLKRKTIIVIHDKKYSL